MREQESMGIDAAAVELHRRRLREGHNWLCYLLDHAFADGMWNGELAEAVAEEGDRVLFGALTSANARAPEGSPEAFLACCGIVGLGRLIAEGDETLIGVLRTFAHSTSPELKEAVEMALDRVARRNPSLVLRIARSWDDYPQASNLAERALARVLTGDAADRQSDLQSAPPRSTARAPEGAAEAPREGTEPPAH